MWRVVSKTCVLLTVAVLSIGAALGRVETASATDGINDYPLALQSATHDTLFWWTYGNKECTSFAAWRMERDGHQVMPQGGYLGDAWQWYGNGQTRGLPVSTTPRLHGIMMYTAAEAPPLGHVVYVKNYHFTSGTVDIEDYNGNYDFTYRERDNVPLTGHFIWSAAGTYYAAVTGPLVGNAAVAVNDSGITVRANTGANFGPNQTWSGPFYGARGTYFADVTGHGQADAIAVNDNAIYVAPAGANGFGPATPWTTEPFYGTLGTYFADVQGYGLAAAIAVNPSSIAVKLSTGSSFGPTQLWTAFPLYGNRVTAFANVKGYGGVDAIAVNEGGISVALNTGTSFATPQPWIGPFYGQRGTWFADVTGNGQADAIVINDDNNVYVALSTGSAFQAATLWSQGAFAGSRHTDFAWIGGTIGASLIATNDASGGSGDKQDVFVQRSTGASFGYAEDWTGNPFYGVW